MGDVSLPVINKSLGLDTLTRQHKQILSLLQCLKERPDARELVHELFVELRVHSILEQQLLFPAISKIVDRDLLKETGKGFYVMLALMLECEQMIKQSNVQFAISLSQVAKHFTDHAERQENSLFPQLEEFAGTVDFCGLEKRLRLRREELLNMAHAGLNFPFCPHDLSHEQARHAPYEGRA
jgi:hypothetical protein